MPKTPADKSKKGKSSSAAAGLASVKGKAALRQDGALPAKSKTVAKAPTTSKAPKMQAVVLKAPKQAPKKVVMSDDEAWASIHADEDDEDDEFPEDGMEFGNSGDEGPTGEVAELIGELGNGTDDEDEEMDEAGELGDDDNAEDVQLAAKITQRKRAAEMELTTGSATALSNKKKRTAPPAGPPATPAKSNGAGDKAAAKDDFTPYHNRINPKDASKPLLSLQTPTTRSIVKKSQHLVRAEITTKQAFPDDDARIDFAERAIVRIAKDIGADRRILRLQHDPVYHDNIVKLVVRAGTQVRGETVNAARDIVGAQYNLAARGSADKIKLYVEFLLTQGNFLYRRLDWEEVDKQTIRCTGRAGPYRHGSVDEVIAQQFFHGHERMALAEETSALFNPMPLPVVAFAATAIQCALRDWVTGVRVKSSASFSADEWSDIYQGHLRELERMRNSKPVEVDMWMRNSWKKAWTTTRQHLNNGPAKASFITAAELDDFSDIIADAAADGLAAAA